MMSPTVTKNAAILFTVHPLNTSPNPKTMMPTNMTDFDPYRLIMLELMMAKNEIQAAVRPPAKERVEDDARPSSVRRD
jgi:hypothetical protein